MHPYKKKIPQCKTRPTAKSLHRRKQHTKKITLGIVSKLNKIKNLKHKVKAP